MNRPICPACKQRPRAVNYHRDGVAHYRTKCGYCIARSRAIKPPEPRWKTAGYKKKLACDKCGFRSRYASQLLVYHRDGNQHNTSLRNLATICLNCVEEIKRLDRPWTLGDLEPDL
jgi:Zn ribbon nucleic-acid-binding protein